MKAVKVKHRRWPRLFGVRFTLAEELALWQAAGDDRVWQGAQLRYECGSDNEWARELKRWAGALVKKGG